MQLEISGGMNKLIILILLVISSLDAYDYRLSIAAITKNENPYLKEWIDYHRLVGVDHFYLYDNNDNNDLELLLSNEIQSGIVELIPWPNYWPHIGFFDGCQIFAYRNAVSRAANKSMWLALIDTDEFIVPMQDNNLVDTIEKHFSKHGFIYVSWLMFGTAGQKVVPGSPILPYLTKCSATSNGCNNYGKTIFRPELAAEIVDVHRLKTPYPYYNGSGKMTTKFNHQSKLLRINHYMLRDENFLSQIKVPRYAEMWKQTALEAEVRLRILNRSFSVNDDYRIIQLLIQHEAY